jgi:hypothetical protein
VPCTSHVVDSEKSPPVLLILNHTRSKNRDEGLKGRPSQVNLVSTVTRLLHNKKTETKLLIGLQKDLTHSTLVKKDLLPVVENHSCCPIDRLFQLLLPGLKVHCFQRSLATKM